MFKNVKAECLDADDIELLCLELGVECERVDMRRKEMKNIKKGIRAQELLKKSGAGGKAVPVALPKEEAPTEVDLHFADDEELALAR